MTIRTNLPVRNWTLIIEGCNAYWGTATKPFFLPPDMDSTNYEPSSIIGLSDVSVSYAEAAPLCDVKPVTITLATESNQRGFTTTATPNDPSIHLLRSGLKSTTWYAQITETVLMTETGHVKIDRVYTGPTLPVILHIGNEAILFDDFYGNSADPNEPIDPMDPENTGPYRLIIDSRAKLSTRLQRHLFVGTASEQPIVVDRVVFWAGRRAVLYLNGRVFWRGVLDRGGSMDGTDITIEILPLTSVIEREIPNSVQTTTLAQNAHYFEREMYWEYAVAMNTGDLFSVALREFTDNTDGELRLSGDVDFVATKIDVTRPLNCPRRGAINAFSMDFNSIKQIYPDSFDFINDDIIIVPFAGDAGIWRTSDFGPSQSSPTAEVKRFTFGPGLVSDWSGTFSLALEDSLDSKDGDTGAWFRPSINFIGGSTILNFSSVTGITRFSGNPQIWFWGDEQSLRSVGQSDFRARQYQNGELVFPARPDRMLWFACDFAAPGETKYIDRSLVDEAVPYAGTLWIHKVDVPRGGRQIQGTRATAQVRDFAAAWYQEGERYILVTNEILLNPVGVTPIVVNTYDRATDSNISFTIFVDEITIEGGFYKLRLSPGQQIPSFGDFRSKTRGQLVGDGFTTLTTSIASRDLSTKDVLLAVLCSTGPDEDDLVQKLPQGLGLAFDDLVLRDFDDLIDIGVWDFAALLREDSTWSDLLAPILSATQRTFSVDWSFRGLGRLRLIQIGVPTFDPNVTTEMTDGDITYGSRPQTREKWEVKNSFKFLTNYDSEDEPQVTTEFLLANDISARRSKEELELELRGLVLDNDSEVARLQLTPLAFSLFQQYAGRKEWSVETNWDFGVFVTVGYNLSVTSNWLRGYGDTNGVDEALARIISIDLSLWDTSCSVVMTHYGLNSKGWAPTASFGFIANEECTRIGDIELSDNNFDLEDLFPIGSVVDVYIRGEHETKSQGTIASFSGGDIIFTSPIAVLLPIEAAYLGSPPIPVNGYITPADYDSATTYHKRYAYLADSAGFIDTGVPGIDLI
jgi:hypothetical protein